LLLKVDEDGHEQGGKLSFLNKLLIYFLCVSFCRRRSIDGRCSQGGDSSETESAPPADDDEDVLEDLRFASEFLSKHQPTKRPLLLTQNPESSDNSLPHSADEGDFYPL